MTEVRFVDTTIRDGQASLWAMNMRTRHMLPAMPHLDAAGFDSMEFIATGSRLKKFVRDLKENPWNWIKEGAAAARETPLRWHGPIDGGRMSGYCPPAVGELLIKKAVDLGIRLNRTGNNWNDYSKLPRELERFDQLGMAVVVNIIYSVSPRHTDEYFVRKAREAAALKPFRLCFKDVGGLLTPERARQLFPAVMQAAGDIEWEFHGHCNNGLGPLNAIEAAVAGMRYIHTAVPPLANANSQPSIYNVAANLRERGFDARIDEELLRPATEHFERVAEVEGFTRGVPYEYDERQYTHQVPGGMISNLEFQLQKAGIRDRLPEVLEEAARVRAEFGYPIMVTPLSQFVGSQAAVNVIVGKRYEQVTDKTIEYAMGLHGGAEALEAMDPDVRDRILDRPRAAQLAGYEPPNPTLRELRERFGRGISDEDLILRTIVGDDAVDVVTSADAGLTDAGSDSPVVALVRGILASDDHRHVSVRHGDLALTIRRGAR